MENSTIIHDTKTSSDSYGSFVDLGNGGDMHERCVISADSILHMFINTYPTLYPVDLVNDKLETAITLPSLTRLCCERIAKEARYLKEDACTRLPVNLYPAILREAIRNEFRKIAFTLMPLWPSKVMSMIHVVPGVQNYLTVLVEERFERGDFSFLPRRVLRLVRLFFYVVKNRLTPHLRVLDLRGVPLSDSMVKYLAGEIISISRSASLLDDYCIFVDGEIRNSNTAVEVINLLKTRKTKIHLHINKLDATWLDKSKLSELLEQISPSELFGLHILASCCETTTPSFLIRFSTLIALDLEIITPCENRLMSTLAFLPQLRRLKFRSFWENCCINRIPKSTLRQLEHLSIKGNGEISLRHLISALPLRLTEVILCCCEVTADYLDLWETFLLSISSTLKLLYLPGCFLNDDAHLATILGYILQSVNLVFLDLSDNSLSNETLDEHIPKLKSLPRLKKVILPKYRKLYGNNEDYDDDYEEKVVTQRCRELEQKMLIGRRNPIQIQWGCLQ